MKIDINCDMGEGMGNEESIIPFISSANIACGYHAGDAGTIRSVMELCMEQNVSIGAHVSFYDKENFGRRELSLTPGEIYELVTQQLIIFNQVAEICKAKISHVKPHGALYNMSARDPVVAKSIAMAVKDFDHTLALFCLSESFSVKAAEDAGLKAVYEVFADRTYADDGSLTPRSEPGSVYTNESEVIAHVFRVIKDKCILTTGGGSLSRRADSICIHGDGPHAPEFARIIHEQIKLNGIRIKGF